VGRGAGRSTTECGDNFLLSSLLCTRTLRPSWPRGQGLLRPVRGGESSWSKRHVMTCPTPSVHVLTQKPKLTSQTGKRGVRWSFWVNIFFRLPKHACKSQGCCKGFRGTKKCLLRIRSSGHISPQWKSHRPGPGRHHIGVEVIILRSGSDPSPHLVGEGEWQQKKRPSSFRSRR